MNFRNADVLSGCGSHVCMSMSTVALLIFTSCRGERYDTLKLSSSCTGGEHSFEKSCTSTAVKSNDKLDRLEDTAMVVHGPRRGEETDRLRAREYPFFFCFPFPFTFLSVFLWFVLVRQYSCSYL